VSRQLGEWKPDIVHVACPGMLVFAAQLYAYALSVPLVRRWLCCRWLFGAI